MTNIKFNLSDVLASATNILTVCRFLNYLSGAVVHMMQSVFITTNMLVGFVLRDP